MFKPKKRNILVVFRKQLGDLLLLQPSLAWLASRSGDDIQVATRPEFSDLLDLMPCDPNEKSGSSIQLAPQGLPRCSSVYCLEGKTAALCYSALALGAHKSVVLTRDTLPWWSRLIFSTVSVDTRPDSYRSLSFFRALGGIEDEFIPPKLRLPADSWQPDILLPAEYGVIHPTAAWKRKTWPVASWVDAISHVKRSIPWVITSGPAEWEVAMATEMAHRLSQVSDQPILNLAGRTSLRNYLYVLSRARITLCVDGSASHISSAFSIPTLTLFGPTNPIHWHWPQRNSCALWASNFRTSESSCCDTKPPVALIPVEAVVNAANALMNLDPWNITA